MATETITRADARAQGLKRYFTGDPCKRGHIAERQVSNLTCMECTCEKQRAKWPFLDKDAERARHRERYASSADVRLKKSEYNKTTQRKTYAAAWFQANKERIKAKPRNDSAANVASAKRWTEANPEKAREYHRIARRKRRARAKNSGGTHTAIDLAEILNAQSYRCAYCRADLRRAKKHVDHIQPLALGGSNGRENLQYLCRPCNQSKSARDPVIYARSIGLLL